MSLLSAKACEAEAKVVERYQHDLLPPSDFIVSDRTASKSAQFDALQYCFSHKYRKQSDRDLKVEQEVLLEERQRTFLKGRKLVVDPLVQRTIETNDSITVPEQIFSYAYPRDSAGTRGNVKKFKKDVLQAMYEGKGLL